MFLQECMEVLQAVLERYVPMVNEIGDYTRLVFSNGKMILTFNNDYNITAWIENGELKLESEYGESIYDFADCYDWTKEDIEFMKFGRKK